MESFTQTQKENKNKWLVVYTKSRWEKKVDKLLKTQNIQSFCPLVKTNRRWVDRNKLIELPLFSSYLFVNGDQKELLKVRQTIGVVNFVHHCGKPATLNDTEIERIRSLVDNYHDIETVSLPRIKVGDIMKIQDGVLLDWQGEVLKIQGKSVIMFMEQLNCALVVNMEKTKMCLLNK
jgi:transcription antitermination factor NusG